MKAMILAAGLGTRLRPLTDNRPKALVEIERRTLLDITLARLRDFGIREVIVNVHHFADMVVDYLAANRNFGMRIEISREDTLLDTGGGLKQAAWFLLEDSPDRDEPFLVHNVDVLSTIDLAAMVRFHKEQRALATLAVQDRNSSRYLLFDEHGLLCGRRFEREGRTELARPAQPLQALAFSGIHIISPRLLSMLTEDGSFSIIDAYLRLATGGERIAAFRADESYWRDLGTIETLTKAAGDLKRGVLRSQGGDA
jgi:mannose-1-phosphate guanylyltransferase